MDVGILAGGVGALLLVLVALVQWFSPKRPAPEFDPDEEQRKAKAEALRARSLQARADTAKKPAKAREGESVREQAERAAEAYRDLM